MSTTGRLAILLGVTANPAVRDLLEVHVSCLRKSTRQTVARIPSQMNCHDSLQKTFRT